MIVSIPFCNLYFLINWQSSANKGFQLKERNWDGTFNGINLPSDDYGTP
jgi:hypothetical protein